MATQGGVSKRKAREEKRRAQLKARNRQQKRESTKTAQETREVSELCKTIEEGAPAPGSNPLSLEQAAAGSYAGARTFEELPLSKYSKAALKEAGYVNLTAIQRAALPHALAGRDILGAAKTGSGKTLCFLVPLVEKLYRQAWTRLDGLGALVLTPTRELAMQIFEELVKVGKRHDMSAGLLIGGKAVQEEATRVNAMNILVATPGRLLQHMDETPGFETHALQLLVLDEADRILDMGFAATLDAIIANLPTEGRQTLLFSATQTKSVRDLARLSLQQPEYLAVHSEAAAPTPLKLRQAYMVVGLGQKMDVLWGFIKSHLTSKTIVFLSTCKQVRFVYEAFRKLRPGTPLRCLHGAMKQGKRLGVFEAFNAPNASGGGGVLFATDIAARGLDFPDVDWVLQADCPEDVAAYIHRVGRTARYTASGRSLLLLLPSERDAMLSQLAEAKVPLQQLRHNPHKVTPIGPSLSALLSKNVELKAFAQSGLVSYCRSVYLQPNKAVFDAAALPLEEYAESLGLLAAPQLKFMRRVGKKVVEEVVVGASGDAAAAAAAAAGAASNKQQQLGKRKRQEQQQQQQPPADDTNGDQAGGGGSSSNLESEDEGPSQQQQQAAVDDPSSSRNKRKQPDQPAAAAAAAGDADDDFLTIKQRDVFDVASDDDEQQQQQLLPPEALAAAAAAAAKPKKRKKQRIKLGAVSGQRTVFDDEGQQLDPLALLATEGFGSGEGTGDAAAAAAAAADGDGLHVVAGAAGDRFERAAKLMAARDRADKKALAALRKQAKLEKKIKRKAAAQGEEAPIAMLGGGSDDGYSSDDDAAGGYSSSDDEGPAAAAEPDVAYLGMARKSAAAGQQQQQQQQPAKAKQRQKKQQQQQQQQQEPTAEQEAAAPAKAKQQQQQQQQPSKKAPAAASLAEQEALALQLLTSQPWCITNGAVSTRL
uniref:ATP-dependent RNA helicase n=1 Tax=Tetradesmus obliquus TaxID=3088 RepID=A0A383V4Y6_TETOB|eukprot:jgi/Sobl393_1/1369/SZX59842.1